MDDVIPCAAISAPENEDELLLEIIPVSKRISERIRTISSHIWQTLTGTEKDHIIAEHERDLKTLKSLAPRLCPHITPENTVYSNLNRSNYAERALSETPKVKYVILRAPVSLNSYRIAVILNNKGNELFPLNDDFVPYEFCENIIKRVVEKK